MSVTMTMTTTESLTTQVMIALEEVHGIGLAILPPISIMMVAEILPKIQTTTMMELKMRMTVA